MLALKWNEADFRSRARKHTTLIHHKQKYFHSFRFTLNKQPANPRTNQRKNNKCQLLKIMAFTLLLSDFLNIFELQEKVEENGKSCGEIPTKGRRSTKPVQFSFLAEWNKNEK